MISVIIHCKKKGIFVWNIWIPFVQQKRPLKIINLNILCAYGTKIFKTDDKLFRNWFVNCHLDQGYCLLHWCSLSALFLKCWRHTAGFFIQV